MSETGRSRASNRVAGNPTVKTPWEETYPGLLRQNGYHVGHVGKWHNGKFPKERFDFGRSYYGKHWYKTADGEEEAGHDQ
mgnify:CR=1 FL=1|jgi:arylsulfatase